MKAILLEELLDSGDARFWDELMRASEPRPVLHTTKKGVPVAWVAASYREKVPRSPFTSFADKWYAHPSPFGRRMLLRYVDDGCHRPGHRPLVRRILALAAQKNDEELIAHLIVALDRLIRLKRTVRHDWQTGEARTEMERARTTAREFRRLYGDHHPRPLVFTGRTREFLRRAALRPLRHLGYRDGAAYVRRALDVLALYEDAHLDTAEKLLASRSLLWILAARSPVLERDARRIRVPAGRQLAALRFAPLHEEAWKGAFDTILERLPYLRSVFVRKQLTAYLETDHAAALASISLARLRVLLASPHPDLTALGASLLGKVAGTESLSVAEWVELALIDDPVVAAVVAERMAALVAPARVSIADACKLIGSMHAPIATLGAHFLEGKTPKDEAELLVAVQALRAKVSAAREALLSWALPHVMSPKLGTYVHVRELFDAPHEDVRTAGLGLLMNERFADQRELWVALSESPFSDVRAFLLRHLEVRSALLSPSSLGRLWATTLLSVHRGSRDKQRALVAVGARLVATEDEVEVRSLVELMTLALRSVREPERRAALGPLLAAAARRPALQRVIAELVPELVTTFAAVEALPPLPARRGPFVPRTRKAG